MSALWIVPALVLLVGAVVLAGLLRGLAEAAADHLRIDVDAVRRAVARTTRH